MKACYLLFVLILSACQQDPDGDITFIDGNTLKTNGFTIITDTIQLNEEKLSIVPQLKHNGKYYCTSYSKDSLGEYNLVSFYILDTIGNLKKIKGISDYVGLSYNDIYISNDSILVKTSFDKNLTFYLDENNEECKLIKTTDDVIFEDSDYYVTALDFGEWGSATWFKDKRTGIEYEASGIITPEVKKFKGLYYLVSPGEINIIKDPKLLHNAGKGAYLTFLEKNNVEKFSTRTHGSKHTGMKTIFSRPITYEREDDFFINMPFIHNNTICYIISDSTKTYVAKVKDKKLTPLLNIGNDFHVGRFTNNYRNLYLNNTILFNTGERKLYGLLEIKADSIFIHYFKNK